MTTHVISRRGDRLRPALSVLGEVTLERARVHEGCGIARRTLAMMVAAALEGPVLWVQPGWAAERLHIPGVLQFIRPGRLIFVTAQRAEDLLWSMEEALRSGAAPLVVADLPGAPGLTPVRRLHLAAETGAQDGQYAPVGLLLTPGDGGAQGVESRWHMAPRHVPGLERWQLERRRARMLPPKGWLVEHGSDGIWRIAGGSKDDFHQNHAR
jgi:protein ImuA